MRDEAHERNARSLLVAPVATAELKHKSLQQQLPKLGELRVYHRGKGSEGWRKCRAGELRAQQRAREQPTPSHDIVSEQLREQLGQVGRVDLVDNAIEAFAQDFP